MGNQLAGKIKFMNNAIFQGKQLVNSPIGTVPTQILPVEHYLQDQPDFEYDSR